MDTHSPYLIYLAEQWQQMTKTATIAEIQTVCRRHHIQALNDLMIWRRLHHDHVLGIENIDLTEIA